MAYVAKEDLYIGFTKARNAGDVVQDDEVERFGWKDLVEKQTKAEAKKDDK